MPSAMRVRVRMCMVAYEALSTDAWYGTDKIQTIRFMGMRARCHSWFSYNFVSHIVLKDLWVIDDLEKKVGVGDDGIVDLI